MAKTNETGSVSIRYQVADRQTRPVTKEKTFKSVTAMWSWVEKQEGKDNWIGVTAYSGVNSCESEEGSVD